MTATAGRTLGPELRRTARRIGLQTAGLLMVCLVAVGAVVFLVVVRSQDQQLTSTLTAAVQTAGLGGGDHDRDRDLTQPRGGIQSVVLDARGLRTSGDIPAGLPDLEVMHRVAASHEPDRRTLHLPDGAYAVLTAQRGDDTVQVIASLFEQHQERERVLGALTVAGGAGLVLTTLAAAVLARRAVRPMAEALDLQRRFVADAGHELRTPLTVLSTRAQLLARRVQDPSVTAARDQLIRRDADGIVQDTASLTAVLEELLVAADTRTPVPQEPVDLASVVASAAASAQPLAQARGVTLAVDTVAGTSATVTGASVALSRAVAALIDNALDHAAHRVEVHVRRESRDVVVTVLDDGPGISAEMLPRVFERFSGHRGPGQNGDRRHFGLGLALVSEIATRHGGSVTAANRPGGPGAALRILLPARASAGVISSRRRDPAGT